LKRIVAPCPENRAYGNIKIIAKSSFFTAWGAGEYMGGLGFKVVRIERLEGSGEMPEDCKGLKCVL